MEGALSLVNLCVIIRCNPIYILTFKTGHENEVLGYEDEIIPGQLSHNQDAAIILPASLFELIDDRTNVGVFFIVYHSPSLFPLEREISYSNKKQTIVGSRVLGATVGPGIDFHDLDEPVVIMFRPQVTNETVNMNL